MNGYVYRITNLQSNKVYVGRLKSNSITEDGCLNDNYWGSSYLLSLDINSLGLQNFKKEILYIGEDYSAVESLMITNAKDLGNCYNQSNQSGEFSTIGRCWLTNNLVDIFILKEDLELYLSLGYYKGRSFTSKRRWVTNGVDNKYIERGLLSQYMNKGYTLGRIAPNKCFIGIHNKISKKEIQIPTSRLNEFLSNGWDRGQLSPHTKKGETAYVYKSNDPYNSTLLIKLEELPDYLSIGYLRGNGNYINLLYVNKNNKNKRIKPSELQNYLKDDWVEGFLTKSTKGKIWIHSDSERHTIDPCDLDKFLASGWKLGKKKCNSCNLDDAFVQDYDK